MSNESSSGFWGALVGVFRVLAGALLLYYFYLFIVWYIKGHFSKYFIFFWAWAILYVIVYFYDANQREKNQREYWEKYGSKSGAELFEESVRSGESYK